MATAFSQETPVLKLNAGRTRSNSDEQEGFKLIFIGVMQGIRNPKAHDTVPDPPGDVTLEYLALASLLMRRLDQSRRARVRRPSQP